MALSLPDPRVPVELNVSGPTVCNVQFNMLKAKLWPQNAIHICRNFAQMLYPTPNMTFLDRFAFDEETCANLRILELINPSDHNLTDDDLAKILARCPNLEIATFCGLTDLSDRTLVVLASTSTALKSLDISGCKDVTDIGVLQIAAGLTSLEILRMNGLATLKDPAVSAIVRNLARLTELELSDCALLTARSVRDIWFYSRKLCRLTLARCPQLTDTAFPHPSSTVVPPARRNSPAQGSSAIEPLTALDPNRSTPRNKSPNWLEELPPLTLTPRQSFKDLVYLNISGCPKVTGTALSGVLMYAPRLRHLDISRCTSLSPALERGSHIARFISPHVPAISDANIVALLRVTSRITTIDLSCKLCIPP